MTLFFGDTTSDKPYRDGSGRPLVGAVLTFWRSGTTAPAAVYGADGFPITDALVTDGDGVMRDIYLDPDVTYRALLHAANGVLVFDVDPYLTDSSLFLSPVYHSISGGRPVPGALLEFFEIGTETRKDTYADGQKLAEHSNPVQANAGGFFPPIYLDGLYSVSPGFPAYPPVDTSLVAVASGPSGDLVGLSDDGEVWSLVPGASAAAWRSVAYAPEIGRFCAVASSGAGNRIMTSDDHGASWQLQDEPAETGGRTYRSVAWFPGYGLGQGRFIVGLEHTIPDNKSIMTSDDGGVTWIRRSAPVVDFEVASFRMSPSGVLVAGGGVSSTLTVMRSLDGGVTWDGPYSPTGVNVPLGGIEWSSVRGSFVGVTSQGGVFESIQGASWARIAPDGSVGGNNVAKVMIEVQGLLLCFTGDSGIYSSPDAVNWTLRSSVTSGVNDTPAVFAPGAGKVVFVRALSDAFDRMQVSDDGGLSWAAASGAINDRTWRSVSVASVLAPGVPFPTPVPLVITSLVPDSIEEGSAMFPLAVHGTGFDATCVVRWNGSDRGTTFIDNTELEAEILAADVAAEGTASVTVQKNTLTSNSETFTIAAPVDPFFDDVVLLCAFDGTDGSTSFPDDSNSAHTLSAIANAQLDTANPKFGTASLLLDGSTDAVSAPDSSDWQFGTGDFTVECFAWAGSIPASPSSLICLRNAATGQFANVIAIESGNLAWSNGAAWNRSSETFALGQWVHVAVTRASGTLRLFEDGIQTHSSTQTANLLGDKCRIGGFDNVSTNTWDGWIDELRITKGVARYTASFTPPSEPFPRS